MKTYRVTIGFDGYFGVNELYEVNADSREQAISEAMEMAHDDLSVEDVEELDEEDW